MPETRSSRRLGPTHPTSAPRRITKRNQETPNSVSSSHKEQENNEEIHEDDLCPICQLLLFNPVITTCRHTLCSTCMAHWADVSVAQQMTIVDVDDEPIPFNPVSDLEAKCPMCRTQTTATVDVERTRNLQAKYPLTCRERGREETAEGEAGNVQSLTVYVGNRHRLVPAEKEHEDGRSNNHEWTFFVKPSRTDIIEEVQILLHPTFRPSRVIRSRAPYEIRRLGWGLFTITAYVILKAGYTWVSSDAEDTPDGAPKGMLPIEWTLDFDSFAGKGSMGRCRLKVKNDREWQDLSDEEARDDAEWQRTVRSFQRDGRYEPPVDAE